MILALLGSVVALPAAAAGGALTLTMTGPATALAGAQQNYTVQWACSSVTDPCLDAQIAIPLPTAVYPTDPVYEVASTYVNASAASGGWAPAPTVANGVMTWTFTPELPAGTSGEFSFSIQQPQGMVPNGSTVTPEATFTATDSPTVTASVTTTIQTLNGLEVVKTVPTPEPVRDTNVTYSIVASYPQTINEKGTWIGWPNQSPGWVQYENIVVQDPLPAGAVFVSASHGGTYDPATHTVTWPTIATGGANWVSRYTVTLNYPSGVFPADGDPANPSDAVVQPVMITGDEIGSGVPATAEGAATHGFGLTSSASGSLTKGPNWFPAHVVSAGATGNIYQIGYRNAGNVPLEFHIEDILPCQWTSPDHASCETPFLTNVSLNGSSTTVADQEWTVTFTSNTGVTQTLEWTGAATLQLPVAAGEYVTKIVLDGTVRPGVSATINVNGLLPREVPIGDAAEPAPYQQPKLHEAWPLDLNGRVVVENCLSNSSISANGAVIARPNTCGQVAVSPLMESVRLSKSISNNAQAPGGVMTVRWNLNNTTPWAVDPEAPRSLDGLLSPVAVDLLPANMEYVEGSFTMRSPNVLPNEYLNLEVIENWNGTGRTLVRASWPDYAGYSNSSYAWMNFQVRIREGAEVGTYQNTMGIYNGDVDYTSSVFNTCTGTRVLDMDDLDGDGVTNEYRCEASAPYTVLGQGAISISKEVKGSEDPDYLASPSVGLINPGAGGSYRVNVTNTGNVPLTHVVAYDILPRPGDVGVGPAAGQERLSEWTAMLNRAVNAGEGATVSYSTAVEPCRGEVITQGAAMTAAPAGCTNDWSTTPPSPITSVTAIRFDYGTTVFEPGEHREFIIPITAPSNAVGVAWNSIAVAAQRVDDDSWLLPSEPPKVGIEVPIELHVSKSVALDSEDADGRVGVGDTLVYTIPLISTGPGDAVGVVAIDVLPDGVTYVSHEASVGTYEQASGKWNLGQDLPGDNDPAEVDATLTIRATVNEGFQGTAITNTVTIDPTQQSLNVNSETTASVTTEVGFTLGDTIFKDSNNSGVQDAGEPGIEGVAVTATWTDPVSGDAKTETVTTDANGNYAFKGLPKGVAVTVTVATGEGTPVEGMLPTMDHDGNGSYDTTSTVTMTKDQLDVDFGFVLPASVGGHGLVRLQP